VLLASMGSLQAVSRVAHESIEHIKRKELAQAQRDAMSSSSS
jgi:hypothetical protein